ncbi:MAG: MarR family winged helix-turn-helix transcriptional regulator [Anaerolineales bacterium]
MTTHDPQAAADQLLLVIPGMMRNLSAELRSSGRNLAPSHFNLLARLHHEHSMTLGELASDSAVSAATMSRTVSTLEGRGWIRRSNSAEDGRIVLVELTREGEAILQDITRQARDWIMDRLQLLSEEKLQTLLDGLEVLSALTEEPEGQVEKQRTG